MNKSRTFRICCAILIGAFVIEASAYAGGFRIAGNVEGFPTFQSVAINNSGQIAFTAQRFVGGQQVPGAYKASGGGFRTILEGTYTAPDGTLVTPGPLAAINDAGKTAFWFTEQVGGGFFASIYTGAGPVSDADLNGGAFPLRIDGSGLVANDLNINQGGSIEFANYVFVPDSNATGSQVGTIFGLPARLLDNQNNVLVPGGPGTPVRKIHMGLVTSPGSPHIGPVSTNVIGTAPSDLTGTKWAMNGSGSVVFQGSKNGQTAGIYRLGGGPIVEVNADSEYDTIGNFALNDSGVVAFYAHSRTLNKWGFFKGPNAVADKILLEGEEVAGVTLSGFSPLPSTTRWFNNSGQVAFRALNALWVADGGVSPPDPASTVLRWNPPASPPSGSFAIADNWQPSNSDPPRVPQKTTTLNDTALFDQPETYTVELGQQHAERLLVKNGNATFQDGAIRVDALSFDVPSVVIDNARLTLSLTNISLVPLISCNHALIGESAASRVDVTASAEWACAGSLRVGGPGEGILTIDSGGVVTSGEGRIGGAGGGHVNVGESGGWTSGNLAIGIDGGAGDLTIQDGGNVHSESAVIGQEAGSGNNVIVQGSSSGGAPSSWTADILGVGSVGTGRLEVRDGASVSAEILKIGNEALIFGSVIVNGSGTNATVSEITTDTLFVGSRGSFGELRIEEGGLVEASGEQVYLGSLRGRATVIVDGVDSGTGDPSTLRLTNPDAFLAMGDQSAASLVIRNGALVELDPQGSTFISSGLPSEPSEIRIEGVDSRLETGQLFVGTTGNEKAFVTLVGGRIEASSAFIGANGVIRGFGTLAVDSAQRLINDGGTISPGLSPGTITINGSYEQQFDGRLLMEIGGTNSADCDHLIITNSATLDGNLTFRFINGFAPKAGQQFDFLSVGGSLDGTFASFALQNLAHGFQFNLVTNGPLTIMTALNDGVFSPALPGQVQVTVRNLGGISCAIATMTVSNTCDRIALDGVLTRTNQSFYQAFQGTTLVSNDCIPTITTLTNTLILGALSPGNYFFNVVSEGTIVQTIPFNVPSEMNRLLGSPSLLSNGNLQFQLDGFSPLRYSIEASPNLTDWIELENGSLPSTFTDFDTAIYPQRFYRARIFQ